MVTPINGIIISPPKKLIGIPTQTQNATAGRKNNVSNSNTKNPPWIALVVKVSRR